MLSENDYKNFNDVIGQINYVNDANLRQRLMAKKDILNIFQLKTFNNQSALRGEAVTAESIDEGYEELERIFEELKPNKDGVIELGDSDNTVIKFQQGKFLSITQKFGNGELAAEMRNGENPTLDSINVFVETEPFENNANAMVIGKIFKATPNLKDEITMVHNVTDDIRKMRSESYYNNKG